MSTEHHFCAVLEAPERPADDVIQTKGRAALLTARHWGMHRRLTVGFMGGSLAVRERVADITSGWMDIGAGIEFQFWTALDADPSNADIRVSIVQNGRSWSVIGNDAKNVPRDEATMNLGWLTETLEEDKARSVILHEFGHALGLIHEHQNPHRKVAWNREAVSADLKGPPSFWDEETIFDNMFRAYDPNTLFATKVDPNSIMMYPIKEEWTNGDFTVGFNTSLSPDDVRLIVKAYPRIGF